MAKKITKKLKLQIAGGKATPAPPVGPALGQAGINIGDFVTKFNAATATMMGDVIPVEISVYEDRTFTFILKVSPVATHFEGNGQRQGFNEAWNPKGRNNH